MYVRGELVSYLVQSWHQVYLYRIVSTKSLVKIQTYAWILCLNSTEWDKDLSSQKTFFMTTQLLHVLPAYPDILHHVWVLITKLMQLRSLLQNEKLGYVFRLQETRIKNHSGDSKLTTHITHTDWLTDNFHWLLFFCSNVYPNSTSFRQLSVINNCHTVIELQ